MTLPFCFREIYILFNEETVKLKMVGASEISEGVWVQIPYCFFLLLQNKR